MKKYIKQQEVDTNENIENPPPDCQEALIKLCAIQPNDPNLENLWKETFNARSRGTSIANYYENYPILKTSTGAILVIVHKILQIVLQFIYKVI